MSQNQQIYRDESFTDRFKRKGKDNPFVITGIAGFLTVLGVSIYKFKNRGSLPISLYLIHTRVAAQGAVIGCITLGMIYQMVQEFVIKKDAKD